MVLPPPFDPSNTPTTPPRSAIVSPSSGIGTHPIGSPGSSSEQLYHSWCPASDSLCFLQSTSLLPSLSSESFYHLYHYHPLKGRPCPLPSELIVCCTPTARELHVYEGDTHTHTHTHARQLDATMPVAEGAPRTLYDKVFQEHIVDERLDGTILLYIGT